VPQDVRDRIWDPFFTTKDVGKGTGLGLDIARRIVVEEHGGRLELARSAPGDTAFVVQLPVVGAA
jgi:signal transduction histidine kinase